MCTITNFIKFSILYILLDIVFYFIFSDMDDIFDESIKQAEKWLATILNYEPIAIPIDV